MTINVGIIFNRQCFGPGVVRNIAPRGIVSVIVSVCMPVTFLESVFKQIFFSLSQFNDVL